ncbi:MAG: hypothetical protein IJ833_06830 [Lachnospiraceae bacterium]|nr:hypothetical protein [Lachnospiraceae bacterium]
MPIQNYWKQFEHTGKVEDYLSYRSQTRKSEEASDADAVASWEMAGKSGGNPYAGIPMGDRNHIETDPYRGIR